MSEDDFQQNLEIISRKISTLELASRLTKIPCLPKEFDELLVKIKRELYLLVNPPPESNPQPESIFLWVKSSTRDPNDLRFLLNDLDLLYRNKFTYFCNYNDDVPYLILTFPIDLFLDLRKSILVHESTVFSVLISEKLKNTLLQTKQ